VTAQPKVPQTEGSGTPWRRQAQNFENCLAKEHFCFRGAQSYDVLTYIFSSKNAAFLVKQKLKNQTFS